MSRSRPDGSNCSPRCRPEGLKQSPSVLQDSLCGARSGKRRDHKTVLWTELVQTCSQHREGPAPSTCKISAATDSWSTYIYIYIYVDLLSVADYSQQHVGLIELWTRPAWCALS